MLQLTIPDTELYDEGKNEFINIKGTTLQLEHSLISISKWEAKWEKPFLTDKSKTFEEVRDYIRCMTINHVDPLVYSVIRDSDVKKITEYIKAKMSATWFAKEQQQNGRKEIVTSELIYYWMVTFNIPFECQKWHLNRLLTLIRICIVKNKPQKKRSRREILRSNAELNAMRRKQYGTKG